MPSITQSYVWAVRTCQADNIGYSQTNRNQRTINGITYYDCSSFVWYALKNGGFDVEGQHGTWPFTTSNMCGVLLALGFVEIPVVSEWLPGDILWRTGHTEMAYSSRVTMGAHTDKVEIDSQVSINTSESSPDSWERCFRYGGDDSGLEWIKGNYYLQDAQMQNNAVIIWYYLMGRGWSVHAICGMLGNMQSESTINPGIWQGLTQDANNGFGLVQWTPSTKYTSWAAQHGYSPDDGYGQLDWLDSETGSEWIETADYPISFADFKYSEESPEYLAAAFLYNFERAGVEKLEERKANASNWYTYLKNANPDIDPGTGGSYFSRKGYKFFLFNKQRWRNQRR